MFFKTFYYMLRFRLINFEDLEKFSAKVRHIEK